MGKRKRTKPQLASLLAASEAIRPEPAPLPDIAPLKPTAVYNTYWQFAAERQRVFFRRLERCTPPWTDDPVLLGAQIHERLPGLGPGKPVPDSSGDLPRRPT